MKVMDSSVQDDCFIEKVTPAKKKKMKQAQLPIKIGGSLESSNTTPSKKRKLSSPLIECRQSKVVKIAKENVSVGEKNNKLNKNVNKTPKKVSLHECAEGIEEDVEIIDAKDVKTPGKVEYKTTPKQNVKGRKSIEKGKGKARTLTMFLKKAEKGEGTSRQDSLNSSLQEEEGNESCENDISMDTSNVKLDDADNTLLRNTSPSPNADADITMLSSNDEDEDEEKLNKSITQNIDSTDNPRSPKTPRFDRHSDSKHGKLTPKQLEKKLQSAKKREEREKMRMEKERKLEEERENRRKEKEERRKEKEEKEKAEKELKLKEKKMKELKKQVEIEQKQKEKEAKEEERRKREEATEEEKRKKEEERLEAERKKQKAASKFASFFVPKKLEAKSIEEESDVDVKHFMPFEVKADMKVAPVCRRFLNEQEKSLLDKKCNAGSTKKSELYLAKIKCKEYVSRTSGKTWPLESKDDDVQVLDDDNEENFNIVDQNVAVEKQRPKLLQFVENRRPPYWGTWRKQSHSINPRKPFSRDTKWFNYEVDSDEEWEEEEPGESLRGSDDEKDEENPEDNEYDVDNEFMVPHGYLSDEEVRADDEEDKEDMTPETQKFKLKVLGEQFETERNTKTSKLKPKIIGCVWQGPDNTFSENVPPKAIEFLSAHRVWVRQIPVTLSFATEIESAPGVDCGTPAQQQGSVSTKKSRIPPEALPDLIRLIHGNTHRKNFLVKEFQAYWSKKNKIGENQIPKASLQYKITEIGSWMACPEEGPMHLKPCWYVPEDTRRKHLVDELTLPNRWSYILTPKRKSEFGEVTDKPLDKEDKDKKHVPLITQFTKKITQEEMKKQLTAKPGPNTTPTSSQQKTQKRATLISVGRGEQFSNTSRKSLMKNFLIDEVASKNSTDKNDKVDDDIVIVGEVSKAEQTNASKSSESTKKYDRLGQLSPSGTQKKQKNSGKSPQQMKNKKSKVKTLNAAESSAPVEPEAPRDIDDPENQE